MIPFRVTVNEVTVGKVRGIVEFISESGSKFKVAMDAEPARSFVDHVNTKIDLLPALVSGAPAQ